MAHLVHARYDQNIYLYSKFSHAVTVDIRATTMKV